MRAFIILIMATVMSGCASMNAAMTPGVKVTNDPYDGSKTVTQKPVSASSSLSKSWHTLGFVWTAKHPDTVVLIVGVNGIDNISDVDFMVDGKELTSIDTASSLTDYGDWSNRTFRIDLSEFKQLANADDVRMKVSRIDEYSVSTFGAANTGAIVNSKFPPFLEALAE
jgi:hypothetical protein